MNKQKGFATIIILVGVLILLGIGGGVYFYSNSQTITKAQPEVQIQKDKAVMTTKTETDTTESTFGSLSITTDVTTATYCGDQNCFDAKFKKCEPATLLSETFIGSFFYRIDKNGQNGCVVTMKYTKNPNPDWENKEMTCTMDNTISLEKSVEKTFTKISEKNSDCTGPLFNIMNTQ